jgi:hypothetical protein
MGAGRVGSVLQETQRSTGASIALPRREERGPVVVQCAEKNLKAALAAIQSVVGVPLKVCVAPTGPPVPHTPLWTRVAGVGGGGPQVLSSTTVELPAPTQKINLGAKGIIAEALFFPEPDGQEVGCQRPPASVF